MEIKLYELDLVDFHCKHWKRKWEVHRRGFKARLVGVG